VLATKGFNPDGPGPNERGNSRINLTRSLENSLRRLGTDYVDLYQCHAYDLSTPLDETMAALDSFVQQGKVRYIGCSNWLASNIVEAQAIAKIASSTPLVSLQPQYSLIVRDIEIDILSTCQRHGLGVIVWSPLGGGLLTGKHTKDKAAEGSRFGRVGEGDIWEMMKRALFTDRNFEIVDKVGEVAKSLGTTHTAVSVAWTVAQSGVTSAIIGPRSVEQLEDNLVAGEITLSDGQLKDLDRASRSPMTYAVFLQRGR
ncbi:MAG: aldo/keto reductase, partial [Actinomycetota bacterium]